MVEYKHHKDIDKEKCYYSKDEIRRIFEKFKKGNCSPKHGDMLTMHLSAILKALSGFKITGFREDKLKEHYIFRLDNKSKLWTDGIVVNELSRLMFTNTSKRTGYLFLPTREKIRNRIVLTMAMTEEMSNVSIQCAVSDFRVLVKVSLNYKVIPFSYLEPYITLEEINRLPSSRWVD